MREPSTPPIEYYDTHYIDEPHPQHLSRSYVRAVWLQKSGLRGTVLQRDIRRMVGVMSCLVIIRAYGGTRTALRRRR